MSNVPFRNIYSNDTTNIATCISPYHKTRGGYLGKEAVRETVKEVSGLVDAHFIQLAHGQVPWYKSKVYPQSEHLKWWSEYFEVPRKKFDELTELYAYVRDGGDILQDFIDACREFKQAAFVSMRLNDGHHIEWSEKKGHLSGIHSINKFLVEHKHLMIGSDLTKWEERTLNWIYEEPRSYILSLITEQCENYDIDGFELDFLRHPYFFRLNETTFEQRAAVMEDFILKVREVLDRTERNGKHRYLCVRVPSNLKMWDEIGLMPEGLKALGVEMVNVSSFFYADQWMHHREFISRMPGMAVYFEVTNCTARGKAYGGNDSEVLRRTTEAEILSAAHLAYSMGGQGLSFFNFAYYREYGVHPELRGPFTEPPFHAIGKSRDRVFVKCAPGHFFIASGWGKNSQLSGGFDVNEEYKLEINAWEPEGGWENDLRMRVIATTPLGNREIEIAFNGEKVLPCDDISEPYNADIEYPQLHGNKENTRSFTVPFKAVKNGINTFTLKITSETECGAVRFSYIDIFPM